MTKSVVVPMKTSQSPRVLYYVTRQAGAAPVSFKELT